MIQAIAYFKGNKVYIIDSFNSDMLIQYARDYDETEWVGIHQLDRVTWIVNANVA